MAFKVVALYPKTYKRRSYQTRPVLRELLTHQLTILNLRTVIFDRGDDSAGGTTVESAFEKELSNDAL